MFKTAEYFLSNKIYVIYEYIIYLIMNEYILNVYVILKISFPKVSMFCEYFFEYIIIKRKKDLHTSYSYYF